MSRRALATKIVSRSGVLPLLERVGSRPALAVLVFHRIMSPRDHAYDTAVIEATPEQFDDEMRMVKKRHSVVAADELAEVIMNPQRMKHFRVAITFDDGYRDNYDAAFPILKSHGLTAAFFVPTSFVDSRRLTWWDQVAYVIRQSGRTKLELDYPQKVTIVVNPDNPDDAIREVLRLYGRAETASREQFIEAVERACGAAVPREASERQFMTWGELREMKKAGMAIGSHTHEHDVLATLSPDGQDRECLTSRALLEEHGLDLDILAYPVGGKKAFDETTKRCARNAGYRVAFSNYGGVNRPEDMNPLDVKRLPMGVGEDARALRFRLALTGLTRRAAW